MRFMAIPRYAMSVNANSFIDAWSDRHSPEQSGGKRRAEKKSSAHWLMRSFLGCGWEGL